MNDQRFRFSSPMNAKRLKLASVAAFLLAVQSLASYGLSRTEVLPSPPGLESFPASFADWLQTGEGLVEPDVLAVLRTDDILNRIYRKASTGAQVDLFIAYYRSQFEGRDFHSPQLCLPGSGWSAVKSSTVEIQTPARATPIKATHYLVSRGRDSSMVLYWYQTQKRAIAGEFAVKSYRILDTITTHRTDMALVRIVTPVVDGDARSAAGIVTDFARSAYPAILRQFVDSSRPQP